jgi:hypothetical protein
MLLVKTEVKPSRIEGMGVFALEPIVIGQTVFVFDGRVDRKYSESEVLALPLSAQLCLYRSMWKSKSTRKYCMCGDNGTYINHSNSPNLRAEYVYEADQYGKEFTAVAARAIFPGEELFLNYTEFDLADFSKGNLWELIRKNFPEGDPIFRNDDRFAESYYKPQGLK